MSFFLTADMCTKLRRKGKKLKDFGATTGKYRAASYTFVLNQTYIFAMLTILSVIIGIVFVLLLFSMLTSAVVEVFHAAFSNRGKHLKSTLEIMLGNKAADFFNHSYFKQLSSATKPNSKQKLPVWISKSTFSSILADILTPENSNLSIEERIKLIGGENNELRKVLDFLWRQSGNDIQLFQHKVENWYDEVMERARDWFADATKWRLFFIGLALAGMLNADTVQIYQSLSSNASVREELEQVAATFAQSRDAVSGTDLSKTYEEASQDLKDIKNLYQSSVASPLGLGWQQSLPNTAWGWLTKLAGWILTGVAVTMGAPFWFDILKKLLSMRGSGNNQPPTAVNIQQPVFEIKSADAPK